MIVWAAKIASVAAVLVLALLCDLIRTGAGDKAKSATYTAGVALLMLASILWAIHLILLDISG